MHSTKYLGVYMDQHLSWNTHIAHAIKKGTNWSTQIRRVAAPSWGLTPKHAQKMFIAVAIPKILYTVDVWGTPKDIEATAAQKKGLSQASAKLTTTQRAGALAITGCLCTTPTDLLDIHTKLLPIHLEIDKQCHRAATHIATLPPAHPLHKLARKCAVCVVKRHASPLHKLMNTYNIRPCNMENIRAALCNPVLTHKRPFTISIPANKEASVLEDSQAKEKVKIYTDRSSHNGKVGAAAILTRVGEPTQTLHYHLGPSTHHTVHEAELIGILLGLHLIKTSKKGRTSYSIGVDNQAALSTLDGVKPASGQYITDTILDTAVQIKKSRNSASYSLKFRWTAGHNRIEGNEQADIEAKKAAEGTTSDRKNLLPLLRKKIKSNKAALKQHKRERLKKCWAQEWKVLPRYNKFKTLDSSFPNSKFNKLISNNRLSRLDASRICQLRMGHIPLNTFLEKIKRVDNARCPACSHPKEDMRHYLLDCPKYKHERWALFRSCKTKQPKMRDLLNEEAMMVPLANFIQATGRFEEGAGERRQERRE
jgi:ribonuclease HI